MSCSSSYECSDAVGLICPSSTNQCNCPIISSTTFCDCQRTSNNEYYWNGTSCEQAHSYNQSCYNEFSSYMCQTLTQGTICSKNGFSNKVKPVINLNKSYRNDLQLWRTLNIETINKLLEYAIRQHNLNRMKFLLKLGGNPNGQLEVHNIYVDDEGNILYYPYLLALINQLSPLYQHNPNIEKLDTPIEELIEYLLGYGADPNILDNNDVLIGGAPKSALFFAVNYNQPRVIELLIQYGADMNYVLHDKSLLMLAIRKTFFELAELLIIHQANLDYINPSTGESAILILLNKNQTDLVRLMIQKGANINYRNPFSEKTLLMFLVEYEELELIRIVLDKGARINDVDIHNRSALYYAQHIVNIPNREIIQLLLSRGAKKYQIKG